MKNKMLEAALYYATEKHWPIFPVGPTKQPFPGTNGVMDATTDPKKIKEFWTRWPGANIALDVGGANMMALDFDPGHSKEDLRKALGGALEETALRQRTPRGGEHWFYEIASDEVVSPSSSKLAPHVDVRSFHSYVLLAPSKTSDGVYTWESEGKPSFRSDEMVRLSNIAREKHKNRDEWIIEPDLPENIAAAEAWLATEAKIAIEGQGGDHAAYATAAMMRSFGLSQETALDSMWRVWNPRCKRPWDADEFDHFEAKVANGYSYCTSPPGNITRAYQTAKHRQLFKPVAVALPTGRELTAGRFRFVDGEGMEHIRPPDWLVSDFLPAGAYALLYGAPGTFKTFIALDIALTIATGATFPWEGVWLPNQFGPVLFALGEGRPEFAKRKRAWEQTHWEGQRVKNLILSDPVPLVSEDWKPFIEGALAMSPEGYKMVVLDTVGRAMQGLNENAQEHASKFTQMVEVLQGELGATVLALHHTGYGEDKRARGSSVFQADADTVVRLDRENKDYVISLTMTKQKDAPEWDKAKWLELRKVDLGEGVDSLAAVKADPKNVAKSKASRDTGEKKDKLTDEIVDVAVVEILKSNPAKAWNTKDLAECVARKIATEDGRSPKAGTIEKHILPDLRQTKGTFSFACYDDATKRWRAR